MIRMSFSDMGESFDEVGGTPIQEISEQEYIVLVPLFKHGKEYQPNDIIRLNRETAQAFISLKEIKEKE